MKSLLEGPDLQALLLQAAQAGGAATRILRAEKVRRGGVYGFFARELFEVEIEIPEPGPASPTVAVLSPPPPVRVTTFPPPASARVIAAQARYLDLEPEPLPKPAISALVPTAGSGTFVLSPAVAPNRLNERPVPADLARVSETFEPREPTAAHDAQDAHDSGDAGHRPAELGDFGAVAGTGVAGHDDELTDVYRLDGSESLDDLGAQFASYGDDLDDLGEDDDFAGEVTFHMDPVFADVPTPGLAPIPVAFSDESQILDEPLNPPAPADVDQSPSVPFEPLTPLPVDPHPDGELPTTGTHFVVPPVDVPEEPAAVPVESAAVPEEPIAVPVEPAAFEGSAVLAEDFDGSEPGRPQFTAMIDQLREGARPGKHRLDGPRHTPDHPVVAETTGLPGNSALFVSPGDETPLPVADAAWTSVIHPEGQAATTTLEADRTMTTLSESWTDSDNQSAGDAGLALEGRDAMTDNGFGDTAVAEADSEALAEVTAEGAEPSGAALAHARATTIVPSRSRKGRAAKSRTVPAQRPSPDAEPAVSADPEELAYTVAPHEEASGSAPAFASAPAAAGPAAGPAPAFAEPSFAEPSFAESPGFAPAPGVHTESAAGWQSPIDYTSTDHGEYGSYADPAPVHSGYADASDELLGQPDAEELPQAPSGSVAWRMLRSLRPRKRRRNQDEEELWAPEPALPESSEQSWDYPAEQPPYSESGSSFGHFSSDPVSQLPPADFGLPASGFPASGFPQQTSYPSYTASAPTTPANGLRAVPAGQPSLGSEDQLAHDREALRTLGVPASWTRHLQGGDRFTSIVQLLDRLPELQIPDDVSVIAVVGPSDVVELEAHRTALDLPADGRPRAVAAVPGAAEGAERRAAIAASKRTRPVVVAVAVDGYDDPAGTRAVLAQVKAESVIAVIDASRPLEETTRWIENLEHVDAIALEGALDGARPAEVLNLDVPVIRVDGIAVDRIGWAALLCAQLAALDAQRS